MIQQSVVLPFRRTLAGWKWAERKLTKLRKAKCKLLRMGRNKSIHQSVLRLESSLAEDPGILMDTELSMRQQRRQDASSVLPGRLRMVTASLKPHPEYGIWVNW